MNLLDGTFSSKALKLQVGAMSGQSISVSIAKMSASKLQLTAANMKVSSFSGAGTAMKTIQAAIKTVSDTRSKLGAIQNRLEHTINNLKQQVRIHRQRNHVYVIQIWLVKWLSTARTISLLRQVSQCFHRLISRHRAYFHFSSKKYILFIKAGLLKPVFLLYEDTGDRRRELIKTC